jgi:hypothetical protein
VGVVSAFIECRVCGKQKTTGDDRRSDAEITVEFEAAGWTVDPTRCPEHVGVLPDQSCSEKHDPEPWLKSMGLQIGGGGTFGSGGRDRFDPRPGYCPVMLHYVENAEEYREKEKTS